MPRASLAIAARQKSVPSALARRLIGHTGGGEIFLALVFRFQCAHNQPQVDSRRFSAVVD